MRAVSKGCCAVLGSMLGAMGCERAAPQTPTDRAQPQAAVALPERYAGSRIESVEELSPPESVRWPLTPVASLACDAEPKLVGLSDRVLFACDEVLYTLGGNGMQLLARLPGLDEHRDQTISDVAQTTSGQLWVVSTEWAEGGGAAVNRAHRFEGGRLQPSGAPFGGLGRASLFSWGLDSVLGVVPDPPGQVRMVVFGEPAPVPKLTAAEPPQHDSCQVQMRGVERGLQVASGDVLLLTGQVCSTERDERGQATVVNLGPGVERLRRQAPAGVLEIPPLRPVANDSAPEAAQAGALWMIDAATVLGPRSFVVALRRFDGPSHVALQTLLLRHDDGSWKVDPTAEGRVSFLTSDTNERLWGIDHDGGLWRELPSGRQRVEPELAAGQEVIQMVFTRQGTWLLAAAHGAPKAKWLYWAPQLGISLHDSR